MEEEIWKPISGYKGLYEVSNMGRVRSLTRFRKGAYGCFEKVYGRIMKGINNFGYLRVCLSKDKVRRLYSIHRLVANAFIPNPKHYNQINHKNEVKTDNRACNLEWCDARYNNTYGTKLIRNAIGRSRPVIQYDKTGEKVGEYFGIAEASRQTKISEDNIRQSCKGRHEYAGGYKWRYADGKE